MPGKLWGMTADGNLVSNVLERGIPAWRPESFTLADKLDRRLDRALDEAIRMVNSLSHPDIPKYFTSAWAIGRALKKVDVQGHDALQYEDPKFIWRVMFDKATVGARSDGTTEIDWEGLRPDIRRGRKTNRQGGRKGDDHWSMCVWLAEQDHVVAAKVFGGSIRNVWQMLERPTLRPLVLRKALCSWLEGLSDSVASQVTDTKNFPKLMKILRQKWPARGRRPALQPIHYSQRDLEVEINRLVDLPELLGNYPPVESVGGTGVIGS